MGKETGNYIISTAYNDKVNTFTQTGQSNLSFYNPQTTITMNLGQASDINKETFIPLTFNKVGQYDFDVQIKAIPTDNRFNKVAKQIKTTAPSYKTGVNRLTASVTVNKPKILATTIPYSNGWTIKGSHSNLIKLGNGFIGIPLSAGKNNIRLYYHTPGSHIGKISFLLGIIICCLALSINLFKTLQINQQYK